MWGRRASKVCRVQAMFASLSAWSAHWPRMARLYPNWRCGMAMASTGTRLTAPWKGLRTMAVMGEGQLAKRSTMTLMTSSLSSRKNADFQ